MTDVAGNPRINFGFRNSGSVGAMSREFVAVYEKHEASLPNGQPLPWVLACGLLSAGTMLAGTRWKKRRAAKAE